MRNIKKYSKRKKKEEVKNNFMRRILNEINNE